jgi:hypothetical protein
VILKSVSSWLHGWCSGYIFCVMSSYFAHHIDPWYGSRIHLCAVGGAYLLLHYERSMHAEEAHEPSLRGLHYEWFLFVLPISKNFNSKWTVTWSYVKKITKKFAILLMGKYHMIPHVIWYHATTPQILNLQPFNKFKK